MVQLCDRRIHLSKLTCIGSTKKQNNSEHWIWELVIQYSPCKALYSVNNHQTKLNRSLKISVIFINFKLKCFKGCVQWVHYLYAEVHFGMLFL